MMTSTIFKQNFVKFFITLAACVMLLYPSRVVQDPVPPPMKLLAIPKIKIKQQYHTLGMDDLHCLARNIYHEARGEPELGQIAVGLVTLNRVKDSRFPNTICAVVTQKYTFPEGHTVCQFSWVCDPSVGNPFGAAWQNSIRLARMLLDGGHEQYHAIVDGAKWFHTVDIRTRSKNRSQVVVIGRHVFFK